MNDINKTTTEKKASPIKTHEEIERIKLIFMKEENKTNDRHLLYFILGTKISIIKFKSILTNLQPFRISADAKQTTTGMLPD